LSYAILVPSLEVTVGMCVPSCAFRDCVGYDPQRERNSSVGTNQPDHHRMISNPKGLGDISARRFRAGVEYRPRAASGAAARE
jgi:hypothetical protein